MRIIALATFLVALAMGFASAQDPSPRSTTICEIVANPATFHEREVVVRGFLVSDYFEHSAVVDPSCRQGLVPMDAPNMKGQRGFERALCSEQGGLVAVTMRGEIRSQPDGRIRFYIREYSNPEHVAYDASWARDTLELESRTSWKDRRLMFCMMARFVDPETRQRIDVAE